MKIYRMIVVWILVVCSHTSVATEIETMTFLIPSESGGGWDTTARETARVLIETGLLSQASFVNIQGGGGLRALNAFIEQADAYQHALMVQSTPLIFSNLNGLYDKGFRDITPICTVMVEYQVVAVRHDAPYQSVTDLVTAVQHAPVSHAIWGASSKGSLDHITAALMLKAGGVDPGVLRYGGYKIGEKNLQGLLDGRAAALVTGYGEIAEALKAGQIRVLGITSPERLPGNDIPTLKEQGLDVVLANWRGFFARPGISDKQYGDYRDLCIQVTRTQEWTDTLAQYGWNSFLKTDSDLMRFLEKQEEELGTILQELGEME